MSKYDYLHALYQELTPLHLAERQKIMRVVEDKFRDAEVNNKDESSVSNALGSPQDYAKQFLSNTEMSPDDIDLDSLKSKTLIITKPANLIGDLELASDSFEHQASHVEKAKTKIQKIYTSPQAMPKNHVAYHPVKIIFMSLAMLFFNLIFLLAPFIAIWSIIIALVASGFALGLSGLALILSGLISLPFAFISIPLFIVNHPVLLFSFGFLLVGAGGLLTIAMIYAIRFFGYITFKYLSWNLSVIRGY